MSSNDRTAALRARRAQRKEPQNGGEIAPRHTAGRPADLVITSDMIPLPITVEASGDLTHDERHQLGVCENAVENLATATWLAGKALQAIRDRRLYRRNYERFDEYVRYRWEISERAAYQMIEEWPLAERLNSTLGKPATASHTRALLPIAARYGLDTAVDLYQQLEDRAKTEGRRLTANIISQIVKAVLKAAGKQAEAEQFKETARQLMSTGALPLTTKSAPKQRDAPPSPTLHQQPPAPAPSPQNFADDHGNVTTLRAGPSEHHDESAIEGDATNSNEAQEFFLDILARAGAMERELTAPAHAGPHDAMANMTRQQIVAVLTRIIDYLHPPDSPA
ncbi:hypothetical protein [Streptomyces hygroscopicus]|uniref:hypothetical protein n=1 Tax=Streptomyces hygroscopicus TaxID=1912 RepID=UPI001FCC0638|nr:hypothetical protein [Streptomyces hygroscopicus]BDH10537.1 hypothetical protein HOK021_17160 [Streptomyces hygroscopicus]